MTIQQTLDPDELDIYRKWAQKENPEEDPGVALEKYAQSLEVQGIFFLDNFGQRCTWASGTWISPFPSEWIGLIMTGVNYFHSSEYYGISWNLKTDGFHQHYFIPKHRPTLASIDRPKPKVITNYIAHLSQSGWNLPRDHPRHICNFPLGALVLSLPAKSRLLTFSISTDVKNTIFEMALVLTSPKVILPNIISCNMEKMWRVPDLHICDGEDYGPNTESVIRHFNRNDRHGTYTERRKVTRKVIDASFLRTSSDFFLG